MLAGVIVAAARSFEADAILVGSRGAGQARAILGSVCHELLHRADRPVTVVPTRAPAHRDRLRELLDSRPAS